MNKTLQDKILEIQKEIGAVKKDSTNPFFNSKYFDINSLLEHVKPVLNKYGLTVTQPMVIVDGKNTIKTIITDGNEEMVSQAVLPDIQDSQKIGSAVTYFRRYTLQSLLALEAEDDDGNTASQNKIAPAKKWTKDDDIDFD